MLLWLFDPKLSNLSTTHFFQRASWSVAVAESETGPLPSRAAQLSPLCAGFTKKVARATEHRAFPCPSSRPLPPVLCWSLLPLRFYLTSRPHVGWTQVKHSPGDSTACSSWRPPPFLLSPSSHGYLISWSFTKCWSSSACFSSFLSKTSLPRKAHPPLWLNPTSTLPTYGWLPTSYPQLRSPRGAPDLCTPTCFVGLPTKISHKPLKLNIPQAHPYHYFSRHVMKESNQKQEVWLPYTPAPSVSPIDSI